MENISVNGKSLKEHLAIEKSREIEEFLKFEIRAMRKSCGGRHFISVQPAKNQSRPSYKEDGRVEVK